ncbi:MAG: SDR family oxidoreductase [Bacteroidota bacterium]
MILVTGGTGLVGSHLLYHLVTENKSVKAIYRKKSDLKKVKRIFSFYTSDFDIYFQKIEWVLAELNDIPSLKKAFLNVVKVYHCAAIVSFNSKDYHEMRKINIKGTTNIVNLCISNQISKLCYVSSIATIEKSLSKDHITEKNFWNTSIDKSGYAITKQGAEMEVWRASQEGVDVIIVNPGVIIGSGYWNKGTGNIFSKIYNGFKYYTNGVTGFVGVKDVVNIMIALMKSDIKNERYILVSENASFKDVFFSIADSFNVKRPSKKVTKTLSEIAWRIDLLRSSIFNISPMLSKHSARASHNKKYYSSKKVKIALNYTFEPLSKTIQTTCKHFLKDL